MASYLEKGLDKACGPQWRRGALCLADASPTHVIAACAETTGSLSLWGPANLLLSWLFVRHCTNEQTCQNAMGPRFQFHEMLSFSSAKQVEGGSSWWLRECAAFTTGSGGAPIMNSGHFPQTRSPSPLFLIKCIIPSPLHWSQREGMSVPYCSGPTGTVL